MVHLERGVLGPCKLELRLEVARALGLLAHRTELGDLLVACLGYNLGLGEHQDKGRRMVRRRVWRRIWRRI